MTTVLISGWNVGFEKIAFTKLLRETFGYSLAHAKGLTDSVVSGETLQLIVPDGSADVLIARITNLGARCEAAVPVH